MGRSVKLSVGILVFWFAGLFLYIAFSTTASKGMHNPLQLFKFLQGKTSVFTASGNGSEEASPGTPSNGEQST